MQIRKKQSLKHRFSTDLYSFFSFTNSRKGTYFSNNTTGSRLNQSSNRSQNGSLSNSKQSVTLPQSLSQNNKNTIADIVQHEHLHAVAAQTTTTEIVDPTTEDVLIITQTQVIYEKDLDPDELLNQKILEDNPF